MSKISSLKLYSGNRLEALMEQLAEVLRVPLASPLDPETIVVQSKGMERWVSMELARRHGICANCRFPFPNAVVDEVLHQTLEDIPQPSPFNPAVMTWRIMRLLPGCVERPGFEALKGYIAADKAGIKQFQLAGRLADLFDQYLLYRPEMMCAWEDELLDSADWQPQLWRELAGETESLHRARLRNIWLDQLTKWAGSTNGRPPGLPQRLSIFGISSLPPFHMEFFRALARFIPVNLFLMNPCSEYWGDIRSEREIGRITQRQGQRELTGQELYLEEGNSLLASLGKLGRDFFQLSVDMADESLELFDEPGEESLLACIRTDILHLTERGPESKAAITEDDRSITVHSCHSPMREVEVLYDQLLALFEEEPGLDPRDVLVMTPDIDAYAPFIHAVFDAPEDPASRIPFTVTDRSLRKESGIVQAFLAILDLVDSRLGAPQVLALLESEPLRRRFGLADADVGLIHRWVSDTRICWGADARSRTSLGFGDCPENSWQAGLDRLLLGYAMPGGGQSMFQGILPYDHIEGSEAVLLGRFVELIKRLFASIEMLAHPRPPDGWADALTRLLDAFFAPGPDGEKEAHALRQVLNDLAAEQEAAGFTAPLSLEVVRSCLSQRLQAQKAALGFITGGVTFCAMLPMRSIPFEVICMVGMSDGAFPRRNRSLAFDMMTRAPRPGDRSQRNDDRYLFLEALLSARRRLYISYVGQSQEDNTALPPSVLVSELLDAIRKGYEIPGREDIVEHLTTRHPLQPFSTLYFKGSDPRYFSYSAENCRAGQDAHCSLRGEVRPFIASRISEPEPEWYSLTVDQLAAFFANPAKHLVGRRLEIQMEIRETAAEEREAFDLDHLQRYLLEEQLLSERIDGHDLDSRFSIVKASGRLPHGAVGICRFALLRGGVESFFQTVTPYMQAPMLPPLSVELSLEPFHLTGRIDNITAGGLVHFRCARIKARDRLSLWARHLVLNTLSEASAPRVSFLIGKDATFQYEPVSSARQILASLLAIYREGLQRSIPFFPRSSYAYAEKVVSGGAREEALKAALAEWQPSGWSAAPGECDDPYLKLCFAHCAALNEEFERLALEVFEPLLQHQSSAGSTR